MAAIQISKNIHNIKNNNTKYIIIRMLLVFTAKLSNRLDPDQVSHVAQPPGSKLFTNDKGISIGWDKGMHLYTLKPLVIHDFCPLH